MEDCVTRLLETGSEDKQLELLYNFNEKYENYFESGGLERDSFKQIWKFVHNLLRNSTSTYAYLTGLKALRILSRDKYSLSDNVCGDDLKQIILLANLKTDESGSDHNNSNFEVIMEAQRCLSNMIYNSSSVQHLCCSNSCIPGLVFRLKNFKNPDLPIKVKYFDARLLFLLSALCADIRSSLRLEYHCFSYLIENIDYILKSHYEMEAQIQNQRTVIFDKDTCDLLSEMLKLLYNMAITINRSNPDEEDEGHCTCLISVLFSLLLANSPSIQAIDELQRNIVNLLLVMPPKLYVELIKPMPTVDPSCANSSELDQIVEYDGKNMSAIVKLLEFMHRKLKNPGSSLKESVGPILTLMIEMCQTHRIIRKFIRLRVLPPLRDVSKRPEDGNSIRNKLCSLMTSTDLDIKFISAQFLFILCKESVDRLIKYTGYGNAAGLLASKGLMMSRSSNTCNYSSGSDDSDTDEYERMKDKVNPVTGMYEPSRPSPLDNMTDEQKEYEAMKLVDALDKLARVDMIQPCRVGEDGRPKPIQSVLELRDDILTNQSSTSQPQEENEEDSS